MLVVPQNTTPYRTRRSPDRQLQQRFGFSGVGAMTINAIEKTKASWVVGFFVLDMLGLLVPRTFIAALVGLKERIHEIYKDPKIQHWNPWRKQVYAVAKGINFKNAKAEINRDLECGPGAIITKSLILAAFPAALGSFFLRLKGMQGMQMGKFELDAHQNLFKKTLQAMDPSAFDDPAALLSKNVDLKNKPVASGLIQQFWSDFLYKGHFEQLALEEHLGRPALKFTPLGELVGKLHTAPELDEPLIAFLKKLKGEQWAETTFKEALDAWIEESSKLHVYRPHPLSIFKRNSVAYKLNHQILENNTVFERLLHWYNSTALNLKGEALGKLWVPGHPVMMPGGQILSFEALDKGSATITRKTLERILKPNNEGKVLAVIDQTLERLNQENELVRALRDLKTMIRTAYTRISNQNLTTFPKENLDEIWQHFSREQSGILALEKNLLGAWYEKLATAFEQNGSFGRYGVDGEHLYLHPHAGSSNPLLRTAKIKDMLEYKAEAFLENVRKFSSFITETTVRTLKDHTTAAEDLFSRWDQMCRRIRNLFVTHAPVQPGNPLRVALAEKAHQSINLAYGVKFMKFYVLGVLALGISGVVMAMLSKHAQSGEAYPATTHLQHLEGGKETPQIQPAHTHLSSLPYQTQPHEAHPFTMTMQSAGGMQRPMVPQAAFAQKRSPFGVPAFNTFRTPPMVSARGGVPS